MEPDRVPVAPLAPGEVPPKKVAWLHPLQLLRTAYHVWLSTTAVEFLDRRETMAAINLVTSPDIDPFRGVLIRGHFIDAALDRAAVSDDGLWIDFVADVGDSWEATYATACLLAKPKLGVAGCERELPSAHVVMLGGDLVYPTPTRIRYRQQMRSPFIAALPLPRDPAACMLAIPGNHDWYDGLTNFVREFCQGGLLGGWRLVQRRSYFAVKLTQGWWLWGIDIALNTRIDPPQIAYFRNILNNAHASPKAERFEKNDRIILCTAEPAWMENRRYAAESYRNLAFFVTDVIEKNHASVPIIFAGDLHHYSRYVDDRNGRQMIVSGGGGAYLMGTHHLPPKTPALMLRRDRPDLVSGKQKQRASSAPSQEPDAQPPALSSGGDFPYPARDDSRRLALGALWLALRPANWPFCLLIGAIYWLLIYTLIRAVPSLFDRSFQSLRYVPMEVIRNPGARSSVLIIVVLLIMVATVCFAVFANHQKVWLRATLWGLVHGLLHISVAVLLAWVLAGPWTWQALAAFRMNLRAILFVLYVAFWFVGGLIGGTLIGVYFVLADRLSGLHHNEVFAAQSIVDYRNFVRINIRPSGEVVLYPVGLRHVPRKWHARIGRKDGEPFYEPATDVLKPHLIEGPIRITANG